MTQIKIWSKYKRKTKILILGCCKNQKGNQMKKHLNLKLPISRKSLHRKKEQNENGESERNENQMDFQCYYLMLECGEFFVS